MKGILHNKPQQKEKKIQWDEQTIQEHDKLRGQYAKIDEPKTPYPYEDVKLFRKDNGLQRDKKQKIDIEALNKQLMAMENIDDQNGDVISEQEKLEKSKIYIKEKAFQEQRKKHYNEFKIIKSLKEQNEL